MTKQLDSLTVRLLSSQKFPMKNRRTTSTSSWVRQLYYDAKGKYAPDGSNQIERLISRIPLGTEVDDPNRKWIFTEGETMLLHNWQKHQEKNAPAANELKCDVVESQSITRGHTHQGYLDSPESQIPMKMLFLFIPCTNEFKQYLIFKHFQIHKDQIWCGYLDGWVSLLCCRFAESLWFTA